VKYQFAMNSIAAVYGSGGGDAAAMRKSARTSYLIKWGAHPCASNTPDIHKLGILSGKLPK
jgi:hypothetical protein